MTPDPLQRNNVHVLGNPNAGRDLVFVHGFGTDQSVWLQVAAPFLPHYRVVLLDNVGAGGALIQAGDQHRYLNLTGYARDLVEVCQALSVKNAVLVGHSVGAMVCALAALRDPSIASRLVMIGASPRYVNDDGYHGGFSADDVNGIYSALMSGYEQWAESYAAAAMDNPERPELARWFAANLKAVPAQQALTVLCAIFQSDHRQDVARLRVPTLIVQSSVDAAVPRQVADYLHQHITASRLAVIPARGHLPHVSAPAEVAEALRDFLGA